MDTRRDYDIENFFIKEEEKIKFYENRLKDLDTFGSNNEIGYVVVQGLFWLGVFILVVGGVIYFW